MKCSLIFCKIFGKLRLKVEESIAQNKFCRSKNPRLARNFSKRFLDFKANIKVFLIYIR
jgi:hypothetical protein